MPSPFIELEIEGRTVKVTNPDKVFFPARGETKLDLVQYYLSVADGIVRALYERPTQLKRHPDGVEGEAIYQKRVPEKRPDWIETATVTFPSGRTADELCVTEVAQVAWAANLATIDFHPWPSRRADVEHPDELRIDVDPQPGTDFADGKRVAALVHEVLDELGYVGWPKTSGNRGIHIACRIEPKWGFREVRRCALAFAREVERRMPDLVTTAWWKEERGEKVFIDYNQNARDRTIASAYSVRRGRTGRCPRRSHGRSWTRSRRRTSRWRRCPPGSRSAATFRPGSTTPSATCASSRSGSSARRPRESARRRIHRTSRRCRASRRACSRHARRRRRTDESFPDMRRRLTPGRVRRGPAESGACRTDAGKRRHAPLNHGELWNVRDTFVRKS